MKHYISKIELTMIEDLMYVLNDYNINSYSSLETALKYYVLKQTENLNSLIDIYNTLKQVDR